MSMYLDKCFSIIYLVLKVKKKIHFDILRDVAYILNKHNIKIRTMLL